MKKFFVGVLLLVALSGFAWAEGTGISAGVEVWNAPEEDAYEDNSFGIAPFAEFEKSIDVVDVYLKGQYFINLDDETNQAAYLEEALTVNLGEAGPGALSLTLDNYNLFGTSLDDEAGGFDFYPVDDGIYFDGDSKKVTGCFEPSVSYAVDSFTFTAGLPIGYAPSGSQYEGAQYVDLYGTIGYTHESGLGIEATGIFNISHEWADGEDPATENFYELDVVLSYGIEENFSATLEADFPKDWDGKFGKDFVFIPGVEAYIQNFTVYAAVEIDYYSDINAGEGDKESKIYSGFLAGVKYAF